MSATFSGRIPESFVQSLITNTDIVALIQESLPLKRSGVNYSACCPFHQEKTPSFTVNAHKQFFHCFGCGKHGDAIAFLREQQSLTFVEAVEKLAARLGLTVPKDPQQQAKTQTTLQIYSLLQEVAQFYQTQLRKHPQANVAVDYLKRRGLRGEMARKYGLGFAPAGWDNLLIHFRGQTEKLKILEETGLIIKHPEGRYYDRFRQRIMFPIRSRKGEVLGFGGRVLEDSQPKYLNSPESAVFQKGHCLYGIYETLHQKKKWRTAIVVEGYFDVVLLTQHAVEGVVATLGTALTPHHLTYLFQSVSEIIFCFDGDKAGQAAAWKALQLVLPLLTQGRQVRFAFLPQGEDPDSFVRKVGGEVFQAFIAKSAPLSEYFFATLIKESPPHSIDARAQLAHLARPFIQQIPAGLFKEMMFEQLAKLTESSLQVMKGQRAGHYFPYKKPVPIKEPPPPQPLPPAIVASALLLADPTLYNRISDKLIRFPDTEGSELFSQIWAWLATATEPSAASLQSALQARGFSVQYLTQCVKKIAFMPVAGREAEFRGAISRLMRLGRQQRIEELFIKAKRESLTPAEKEQLKALLKSGESN